MGKSDSIYQIQFSTVVGFGFNDDTRDGSAYTSWLICEAIGYIIHFIKNIFKIVAELILSCKKFSGSELSELEWTKISISNYRRIWQPVGTNSSLTSS